MPHLPPHVHGQPRLLTGREVIAYQWECWRMATTVASFQWLTVPAEEVANVIAEQIDIAGAGGPLN